MSLLGIWIFVGLLYQDRELPPPNPALKIVYQFTSEHENILRYWREGEQGFCERRARYTWRNEELYQKVIETHPENAPWCSQDPDMRLGFESWTALRLKQERLYLQVLMGEEDLDFIWQRQTD